MPKMIRKEDIEGRLKNSIKNYFYYSNKGENFILLGEYYDGEANALAAVLGFIKNEENESNGEYYKRIEPLL